MTTSKVNPNTTHHHHHSSKLKHNCDISSSKPENEEIYTNSSNNKDIRISSSIIQKKQIGDYINEDIDEESTAIISKNKIPIEHVHRLSTPSNNSSIRLQQQGTGDHYHTNTKQHKTRSKTTGKYHRLIEQQDLDERNVYHWRLIMYILIILILVFVIYRFLIAIWPKPKKTFMKQLIDDFSDFFTP